MNTSLLTGWLPILMQVIAVLSVAVAVGRRSMPWVRRWIPVAVLVGVLFAFGSYWLIRYHALADGPAPVPLWLWMALTGIALTVAIVGWRGVRWWRRAVALLAVPMCLLCAGLTVNTWTGYLPTVRALWNFTTNAELENQIDEPAAQAMRRRGERPGSGRLVTVKIPGQVSGFPHRDELVYLPPAWFASGGPQSWPAVLMIDGEFGWPADWPSTGGAQRAADNFATAHDGNTPILVFPDTSGEFTNDTECVNGPRGNAADHLVKEVVPYVISHFSASADASRWAVAGWSVGGTCAVMTTAMHPEMFNTFLDIDGQLGPNAGSKEQTIARLFGGDAAAYDRFDPLTVLAAGAPYSGITGLFAVSGNGPALHLLPHQSGPPVGDPPDDPEAHEQIAKYLCQAASNAGMECSVDPKPGDHKFDTAKRRFEGALPWLAGRLHTPGIPEIPLPGTTTG